MNVRIAAAECDDLFGTPARCLHEPVAILAVVRNDGDAPRLQPLEDLGLGIGDRLFGAEILDVRGSDGRNDRDVRTDLAGQGRDLAPVVHPHFKDRKANVARHPREAQRHARVVVVALDRTADLARRVAIERGVERFLRARLSDRARDSEDRRLAPLACSPPERLERRGSILDEDVRPLDGLRNDGSGGSGGKGLFDEFVPVMDCAGHRNEEKARLDLAAIEGHADDFERLARRSAGRLDDFVGVPERAHDAHSRATSASSKGSTRSPTIWPVSWPLPATRMMSPALAIRIASAIASRRPPTSVAPGAPAMIAERMVAGSSPRGLSSVTMTTSDNRAATAPISGLLPWSRSPPAPNTVISRPSTC